MFDMITRCRQFCDVMLTKEVRLCPRKVVRDELQIAACKNKSLCVVVPRESSNHIQHESWNHHPFRAIERATGSRVVVRIMRDPHIRSYAQLYVLIMWVLVQWHLLTLTLKVEEVAFLSKSSSCTSKQSKDVEWLGRLL